MRRSVESSLLRATLTRAPFGPEILRLVAPGWTARKVWSKKNLRVRVSYVRLRAVIATETPTLPSSGRTV